MSDVALATVECVEVVPSASGVWPDFLPPIAFELWALECGQDARKVATRLKSGDVLLPDGRPFIANVSDRTIRYWSQSQQWSQEFQRRMQSVAPQHLQEALLNNIIATVHASRWLVGVASGAIAVKDERTRMEATKLALSHTFGNPVIVDKVLRWTGISGAEAPELHGATPDDLDAWEEEVRKRSRAISKPRQSSASQVNPIGVSRNNVA